MASKSTRAGLTKRIIKSAYAGTDQHPKAMMSIHEIARIKGLARLEESRKKKEAAAEAQKGTEHEKV